jgi:transcriptional regulator with XRE-family HTH domain
MDDAVQHDAVVCIAVAGDGTRRLRALRVAGGLTQAQLATRSGITQESISRLERGIQRPQACTLQREAAALGVPPDEVMCVDVGMLPRSSAAFRERLVAALDAGPSRRDAVQHFGVSPRSLARWLARHRAEQSLANQPLCGR